MRSLFLIQAFKILAFSGLVFGISHQANAATTTTSVTPPSTVQKILNYVKVISPKNWVSAENDQNRPLLVQTHYQVKAFSLSDSETAPAATNFSWDEIKVLRNVNPRLKIFLNSLHRKIKPKISWLSSLTKKLKSQKIHTLASPENAEFPKVDSIASGAIVETYINDYPVSAQIIEIQGPTSLAEAIATGAAVGAISVGGFNSSNGAVMNRESSSFIRIAESIPPSRFDRFLIPTSSLYVRHATQIIKSGYHLTANLAIERIQGVVFDLATNPHSDLYVNGSLFTGDTSDILDFFEHQLVIDPASNLVADKAVDAFEELHQKHQQRSPYHEVLTIVPRATLKLLDMAASGGLLPVDPFTLKIVTSSVMVGVSLTYHYTQRPRQKNPAPTHLSIARQCALRLAAKIQSAKSAIFALGK